MTDHAREAGASRNLRLAALVGGVGALVSAVLLGMVITLGFDGVPPPVDAAWDEFMVGIRGPAGDAFAYFMNAVGGGRIAVFLVPVTTAVALLFVRRPWGAAYFIVVSAASAGVVQVLKNIFDRARPDDIIVASDFGSFPSGHVTNAATIAVAFGVMFPRVWVWVLGAVYTVLMAISRTYLGAHWLSDTLGGLLVGAGVAFILWSALAVPLERERLARVERRHVTLPTPPSDG